MIIILSPAKTMKVPRNGPVLRSVPKFSKDAQLLASELKKLPPADFFSLLRLSGNLAHQAYDNMQQWSWPHDNAMSSCAAVTYDGPAFKGLNAESFTSIDWEFAQSHLRILSGLYGVLRPADIIMLYRLEMQTPLSVGAHKNLYAFWNSRCSANIEAELTKMKNMLMINLTSEEYGKMITPYLSAKVRVINVAFKEMKAGKPFINVVEMKKARGMMSRFIIQNQITDAESLIAFDLNNYHFKAGLSDENNLTFLRG